MSIELPMFPLGSVLFPSIVLPLHLFEPRYRALAEHLLGGEVEPEFGVVLIERGREVGGDDVRTDVGTVARIHEAAQLPDGRWALVCVGTRRIRVLRWLDDDPFPRAVVEDLLDADEHDVDGRWPEVAALLRRTLALAAELGEAKAPVDVELADDPALASLQAAAVAPIGPLDQLGLLATTTTASRLSLLVDVLSDQAELLEARLRFGG